MRWLKKFLNMFSTKRVFIRGYITPYPCAQCKIEVVGGLGDVCRFCVLENRINAIENKEDQ